MTNPRRCRRRAAIRPSMGLVLLATLPTVAGEIERPPPAPRLHSSLSSRVADGLREAHALARSRLEESPPCAALFGSLEHDGWTALEQTLYVGLPWHMERRLCTGVVAFTTVASRVVRVCSQFARLHPRRQAVVLLHEALHSAGLREWPADRAALSPGEIDELVVESCDL